MRKSFFILILSLFSFLCYSQSGNDYLLKGKTAIKNNEPQKAIDNWTKALNIFTDENNIPKIKETLHLLADLYNSLQLYDDVILTHQKILSFLKSNENTQEKADSFFSIGFSYNQQKDREKAIQFFKKSLEINKALKNKIKVAKSLYEIGNIHSDNGQYEEALSCYREAIKNLKKNNSKNEEELLKVILYKQIAKIYMYKEKFDKAILCLEDQFTLIYKQQDYKELADYFNTIGDIKILQNKFDTGIRFYQVAFSYLEKLDDKVALSKQLIKVGYCYLNHKKYNEAIASFTNSYIVNSELKDTIRLATDMENIATVYETMQQYKYALKYYNKSLIFNWEKGNTWGLISNSLEIGRVYYKLGIYNVAIEHFEEGCKVVGREPTYNDESMEILEELHRYLISAYIKDSNPKNAFAAALKNAVYSEEIKRLSNEQNPNINDILNLVNSKLSIVGFFLSDKDTITRFLLVKDNRAKDNIQTEEFKISSLLSLFDNNKLESHVVFNKRKLSDIDKLSLIINYLHYLSSIHSLTRPQQKDYNYLSNLFGNFFLMNIKKESRENAKILFINDKCLNKIPFDKLLINLYVDKK